MIDFYNTRTKETRTAHSAEHIAAFYNSSDLGPNARNGQDMGWRLSPAIKVRLDELLRDEDMLEKIADKFRINREDIREYTVLQWISIEEDKKRKTDDEDAQKVEDDATELYEQRIRNLKAGKGDLTDAELKKQEKAKRSKAEKSKSDDDKKSAPKKDSDEEAAAAAGKTQAERAEKSINNNEGK